MTTTSPTPVRVPAATGHAEARPTAAADGSTAELAAAFAAMVDALVTGIDVEAEPATTDPAAGEGAEASAAEGEEAATLGVDLAALLAVPLQVAAAPAAATAVVTLAVAVADGDGTAALPGGTGATGAPAATAATAAAAAAAVGEGAEVGVPLLAPGVTATSATEGAVAGSGPVAAEAATGEGSAIVAGPLETTSAGQPGASTPDELPAQHPQTEAGAATAGEAEASPDAEPGAVTTTGVTAAAAAAPATTGPGTASAADVVVAVGPTGLATPAATVDAAKPVAAAAAPPPVPEQLVTLVSPLRKSPDGTHRMSLQLRPEELGGVTVDVRVLGNQISLHLRADVPGTTDLLRASLADLRADLEAAGFDAGSLDVGVGDGGTSHDDRDGDVRRDASGGGTAHRGTGAVATAAPLSARTAAPAAGIDIRL